MISVKEIGKITPIYNGAAVVGILWICPLVCLLVFYILT